MLRAHSRVLLGPDSIAAKKLEFGPSLCILGIDVALSATGIVMKPVQDKAEKWMCLIRCALGAGVLRPGEASKLAGKLGWATTHSPQMRSTRASGARSAPRQALGPFRRDNHP